jgi:dGTPase
LIPQEFWSSLCVDDSKERRVCDYIAGMTDPYAEKIYSRLFVPGFGSSTDEI